MRTQSILIELFFRAAGNNIVNIANAKGKMGICVRHLLSPQESNLLRRASRNMSTRELFADHQIFTRGQSLNSDTMKSQRFSSKAPFFSFFQKRNSGQKFHWFRMDDSLKGWFYICLESKHNHVLTVVDRPWQVTIKENELVLCPFLIKQSLAQGSNYVPWRMARINCGPGIEVSWSTSCPVVVGVSGDLPSLRFQRMSYAQLPHSLFQVMSVKRVPNAKDQTLVQDRRKSRESAHAQLWRWEEDGSLVLADYPAYCLVSK